jgi:DNA-binding response OmpR family regulator
MQFDAGHGQPVKSDSSAGPFPRMNFCNRCGCNLAADHPIDRGDWSVALHGVEYKGKALPTSPAEASMLHSLAAARGTPVSAAVLAERSGYEGLDPVNLVSVTLCRLRHRLPETPFENVRGFGYRWAPTNSLQRDSAVTTMKSNW